MKRPLQGIGLKWKGKRDFYQKDSKILGSEIID